MTAFNLFDKIVVPVLCYGAEVWGYALNEKIERVHSKFCKRILGVSYSTSSVAVLGDCGRFPLHVEYFTKCIKYWLKILNMPQPLYGIRYVRLSCRMTTATAAD